jgi:hypothetical protein
MKRPFVWPITEEPEEPKCDCVKEGLADKRPLFDPWEKNQTQSPSEVYVDYDND